jgi:hypothetical protein
MLKRWTVAKAIGIIQTRGIGDLILALPIAHYYHSKGYTVYWPISSDFIVFMRTAAPYVTFLPVERQKLPSDQSFFIDEPRRLLELQRCTDIRVLYNVTGGNIVDGKLGRSLKFDEYKYAICHVPFSEKWNLRINRDMNRERDLNSRLNISGKYICVHRKSGTFQGEVPLLKEIQGARQLVEVEELTDNPFDWIYTLEHASKLVLLDSCYANLVEQLNIPTEKYLILRSVIQVTPVFKNGWEFI